MPKKGLDKNTRVMIIEATGKTVGFIVDSKRSITYSEKRNRGDT